MKYIVRYDEFAQPPILRIYAHGHPHKRQHREVLQQGREELVRVAKRSIANQVDLPINHPIDLEVLFTNPSSSDLDHLIEALFQMLDGKSLKGQSILTDDKHIQSVKMSKYYNTPRTKRDSQR